MPPFVRFVIVGLVSVLLLAMVFWYRDASAWIRRLFFAWSVVEISWAALGIIRVYHLVHFTRTEFLVAQSLQAILFGVGIGLFIAALLSADFWKVSRHYHYWYGLTNRSSRPLADEKIPK
jgi:fatty acid desaturase